MSKKGVVHIGSTRLERKQVRRGSSTTSMMLQLCYHDEVSDLSPFLIPEASDAARLLQHDAGPSLEIRPPHLFPQLLPQLAGLRPSLVRHPQRQGGLPSSAPAGHAGVERAPCLLKH